MARAWGFNLAVYYSYSAEDAAPKPAPRPAGLMPLLVILFIVSYAILTLLVFEQGQTIESQRSLIREMLKDSTQLAALKDKMARDESQRIHEKASAPIDHKNANAGSPAAGAKGPEAKGLDKGAKLPGKSAHSTKEIPGKPAADLDDVRRSTRMI
jgi:hypothetical protein